MSLCHTSNTTSPEAEATCQEVNASVASFSAEANCTMQQGDSELMGSPKLVLRP